MYVGVFCVCVCVMDVRMCAHLLMYMSACSMHGTCMPVIMTHARFCLLVSDSVTSVALHDHSINSTTNYICKVELTVKNDTKFNSRENFDFRELTCTHIHTQFSHHDCPVHVRTLACTETSEKKFNDGNNIL